MWRSIASNALTLFVVLLAVAAGILAWGRNQYVGPGPLAEPICLRVEKGATVASLSKTLEEQQAISYGPIFRIGARYSGKSTELKFGSYLVPAGASMEQILGIATRGGQSTCGTEVNYRIGVLSSELVVRDLDPKTGRYEEMLSFDPAAARAPTEYAKVEAEPGTRFRVTLAEGVTSWQVVDALKRADFLDGKLADVPAEGSLLPDSYEVTKGSGREALIAEMRQRRATVLDEQWANRAEGLPYKTPEEALVMASLVEKETGVPGERAEVASVFVNRLDKGIRLQTDPAVIYGITKGKGALGRGLRQSELRRKTPYNTYVIDGLPPTPICNPGRDAIKAALHPAQTDYLYFVADGSGGHAFSSTLAEHNRNVANWRKIEAERRKQEQDGSGN
ncbi:endolytic transglycosylase MltG [Acidimangrovimonas pyrenivorans]|uniref:Endolytic murein transglycosylase n=1 Tax=Acidimangrovimonas pyrenivorans TaxID=2030798 RepID=A0ABV7AFP1_9RHOB